MSREIERCQNNLASSLIPESGCVPFMMEGARGLREVIIEYQPKIHSKTLQYQVIPNQSMPVPVREFTVTTGGTQSTLQVFTFPRPLFSVFHAVLSRTSNYLTLLVVSPTKMMALVLPWPTGRSTGAPPMTRSTSTRCLSITTCLGRGSG